MGYYGNSCYQMAYAGYCQSNYYREYMCEYCSYACESVGGYDMCSNYGGDDYCTDTTDVCSQYYYLCYSERGRYYMYRNCRATCGFCNGMGSDYQSGSYGPGERSYPYNGMNQGSGGSPYYGTNRINQGSPYNSINGMNQGSGESPYYGMNRMNQGSGGMGGSSYNRMNQGTYGMSGGYRGYQQYATNLRNNTMRK
uniref:ShKT domain-containing protein n=1 Tax=Parastrongyloides trichosuri TaxID=131310 RepID=A0A0N5A6V2_PARTI